MNGTSSFGRGGASRFTATDSHKGRGVASDDDLGAKMPLVTLSMVALLAVGFVVQTVFTDEGATRYGMTTALGGLSPFLAIDQQEWWRIFTAPFLHLEVFDHLLNAFAIVLGGYFVEKAWGAGAVILLFLAGGIAGSVFSLFMYSDIYVGASGQAGAFSAASVLASLRQDDSRVRYARIAGVVALFAAVAALVLTGGIWAVINTVPILGGIVSAFLLSPLFMNPGTEYVALKNSLIAVLVLCTAVSVGLGCWHYGRYIQITRSMAPNGVFPKNVLAGDLEQREKELKELAVRYPGDPMPHLYLGLLYYALQKSNLAVSHLSQGLQQDNALHTQQPQMARRVLREYLMLSLIDQGRISEAKTIAGPSCHSMGILRNSRNWKKANRAGVCN